jgi:hypothetical protein
VFGTTIHPSLIFAGEARSLPLELSPVRASTPVVISSLACKHRGGEMTGKLATITAILRFKVYGPSASHSSSLKRFAMDEHDSLVKYLGQTRSLHTKWC